MEVVSIAFFDLICVAIISDHEMNLFDVLIGNWIVVAIAEGLQVAIFLRLCSWKGAFLCGFMIDML
jgi:hypothetical protein